MIGQTISHYKILEKLGEGGMGAVYKAEDTKLKRTVALKFLPPELTRDEHSKARFVHEAQAASALDHPNICTIHEIDETEDGRMFICMACYEGTTLTDKISERPLELGEAVDIAMRVAEGLAKAHEQGIVHRDLKPANVLVTKDGQVKIVDFGLAKLAGRTKLTKDGMTAGTVGYMSPEQAKGLEVNPRTDIWSLGTTLYQMITGRLPFESDYDEALVYSILHETAEPVTALRSGVPLELDRIVTKCMQKDPAERYQTAGDLIADLRHLNRTMGDRADTSKRGIPSTREMRSLRMWPLVLGLVVVAVVVAGILSRFRAPSGPPSDSEKVMLVVLPFENLGPPDDEYLAVGVTEEVTNRLASIKELGVISRKSAVHYAGTDKTTKQIGSELGVQYVVEGTIQWAKYDGKPSRVRITPELVRVADDTRLWSEAYDRVIEDVFEIQSDIALQVVEQLGLTLLASDRAVVADQPTDNLEAYHAYLRGGYYTGTPHFTEDKWVQAIDTYTRAVELDPTFALAYAKLSEAHAGLYYYHVDLSGERREMARSAVEKARELAPDQPETRLALGYYHLMVERDAEQAFAEFEIAARDLPEDDEVLEAKGDGYRQQGKWLEAFDEYERACQLSPRNSSPLVEIGITGWLCRRYRDALEAANKAIALAPNQDWPYLTKGVVLWSWHGASEEARRAFEAVSPGHRWLPWVWYWQYVYEGKYREAIDYLSSIPDGWVRIKIDAKPKELYQAFAFEAIGQPEQALAAYETAKTLLEAEVKEHLEDPRYHSSLGVAYAALGQKEEAIREGRRAMELLPISKDAVYGLPYVHDLAHIYTLSGDYENALATLEEILSNPSSLSVPLLEVDPRWNRLRDQPGFQRLLTEFAVADS
jgi:serine/threonine protein kinase/tetratricopeptide (TPR) repeat protein